MTRGNDDEARAVGMYLQTIDYDRMCALERMALNGDTALRGEQ